MEKDLRMPAIEEYKVIYEDLMESPSSIQRDLKLAALMTRMEQAFHIPMLKNEEWEKEHREVIGLYRQVSDARSL
ncbi:hypothetical protein [Exiguobacterium sp. s80]|uniref:hypothetical protein n=1 Tax=Exiguobacterium sp. s80 TaxID=2751209 RepID=UPI0020376211|nr:hypothetical protein [Exiguobacterium sp. s80]